MAHWGKLVARPAQGARRWMVVMTADLEIAWHLFGHAEYVERSQFLRCRRCHTQLWSGVWNLKPLSTAVILRWHIR
jgi:hypothetical protein